MTTRPDDDEVVAAGQQDAIEDLIATIAAQQATIDTLVRTMDDLNRRLRTLEAAGEAGA